MATAKDVLSGLGAEKTAGVKPKFGKTVKLAPGKSVASSKKIVAVKGKAPKGK
jgi:hypothetical protein